MSATTAGMIGGAAASRGRLQLKEFGVTPTFWSLMLVLSVASQIGFVGFIVFLKHVMDGMTETRNADSVIGFGGLFFFVMICSALYQHLRGKLLMGVGERLGLLLQARATESAVRNAVRTDASNGVAMLQDIAAVQRFVSSGVLINAFDLVGSLVALAMLFYMDNVLGWIGVGGIATMILFGWIMYVATRAMVKRSRKQLKETSAELGGQMVHPDLVRGVGLLGPTLMRWRDRYSATLGTVDTTRRRVDSMTALIDLLSEFFTMAIKGFACYLIFIHVGTLGMMIVATFCSHQAIEPFATIARNFERWSFAGAAWKRVQEGLDEDGEAPIKPPTAGAPAGLVFEDVGFWPQGRKRAILGGISLRLPPGTAITVEGPNGVGKSSLLRLALGLVGPTTGRVLLDGQDTHFVDRAAFGERVGYLPQDVQLLEGTVFDNIGRGPDAPAEQVIEAARIAGAHELIGHLPVGYQTPAGNLSGLSAGQRRLVGLARAVFGNPRLVVLDEPEVGLDGQARMAMRSAVAAVRDRGGIVMIVTHEPETWADAVDLRLILGAANSWQVQPANPQAAATTIGEPVDAVS